MKIDKIRIINAKTHNLKGVTVEIPRNSLTVFTGLSGSGKSSLAFDTLYAEGQRRYVESLSAYARQFLDRLGKPDVERIEGLSPAISIEQHTSLGNPRSIVATVTEIHDYLRILYGSAATAHCPKCGKKVSRQSADQIVDALLDSGDSPRTRIIILSPVVKGKKGSHESVIQYAKRNGFARLYVDGEMYHVEEVPPLDKKKAHSVDIVIDRLQIPCDRTRLVDSVELALKEGSGILRVMRPDEGNGISVFSELNACVDCGISFEELKSRSFSFNSPFGACPKCSGLGHLYYFDEDLVVPDKTLPLRECIHPFRRAGHNAIMYYNALLEQIAKQYKVKLSTPYRDLPPQFRKDLMHGFKDDLILPWRSVDKPFEGVFAVLQRRLEEAQDDSTRQKYEAYRSFRTCPECNGARLNAFSRSAKLFGKTIVEVMAMNIRDCLDFFRSIVGSEQSKGKLAGLGDIADEIIKRLGFLVDVGLDYLTLDRSSATLSGGEMQRIRLATQIGSGLTGVLYVLDEPTIGLHPRDNERLISTLKGLRDKGNTLVVVEHDAEMIKNADWIVDLGPGAGVNGGEVVYQGPYEGLLRSETLTAKYLTGRKTIDSPKRVEICASAKYISITGAAEHNLKNVSAKFPVGAFSVVTGVSGSGKSTLVEETLKRALFAKIYGSKEKPGRFKRISGVELIDKVVEIDQSPIGRTPRSNPATYVGFFSEIRELFAQTPAARARGFNAGRFSFNVKGGRCEVCSGDGVRKLEMSFLPDVYVTCEQCNGRRFNAETLEVAYNSRNISQVLDMSVSEACEFFAKIPSLVKKLNLLKEVGLGYMALGQSATTLSGGEAQRIKLASELTKRSTGRTLYLLDEPTTGLHFDDVSKLMKILFDLRDQGNTIIVIEHNTDVIRSADWIVDLGPEGGCGGGQVVYQGRLDGLISETSSHTAKFL